MKIVFAFVSLWLLCRQVWLATDYSKVPVSKDEIGVFFNGSSYVVLYHGASTAWRASTPLHSHLRSAALTGTRDAVLYFWQGSKSPTLWTHARESILDIAQKAHEKTGTSLSHVAGFFVFSY